MCYQEIIYDGVKLRGLFSLSPHYNASWVVKSLKFVQEGRQTSAGRGEDETIIITTRTTVKYIHCSH